MPWRSSRSSASARRSGRAGNSFPVSDQRPCVDVTTAPRWREKRRGRARGARLLRRVAATRAQRRPRVVRHLARPHELPQRGQRDLGVEAGRVEQVDPELRAAAERLAQLVVCLPVGRRRRRGRAERRRVLAEEDRDAVEAGADPDDLAGRAQLVEVRGLVVGDAARQHLRLPQRHGRDSPCSGTSASRSVARRSIPCHAGRKRPKRRLLGGLDLFAQRRERRAAQAAQDVGVAPLALGSTRDAARRARACPRARATAAAAGRRGRSARSPRPS